MKRILLILSLLFSFISSNADHKKEELLWAKANIAYQNKQYDSAIVCYESLLKSELDNAQIYFNLGNAYYKNNQVSQSVLCYERALFYDPSLSFAKDNLLLAKNRIPNNIKIIPPIFFVRWWQGLTTGSTANFWTILSLCIFLGFIGLIFYSLVRTSSHKISYQVYLFIPVINLLVLFLAFTATRHKNKSNLAVVIGLEANMQKQPNLFKGQSIIPEATTVEINHIEGNWVAVSLPDDREGWMKKSDLAFVHKSPKTN